VWTILVQCEAMGSSSSATREEARKQPQQTSAEPAQPLALPIQNRRTRAVTLSPTEPQPLQPVREAANETGGSGVGVCLPIKNRRTRGVILEAAEFNPESRENRLAPPGVNGRGQDVASSGEMTRRVRNLGQPGFAPESPVAVMPRLPSSPAATSSARTSSVPASPSVMSRNSRVHFAASPASVVEITPYSWTSGTSPCSPAFSAESSPVSQSLPQQSQGPPAGNLQPTLVIPQVQYVHYTWTPVPMTTAPVPPVLVPPIIAAAVPAGPAVPAPVATAVSVTPVAPAAWQQLA